MIRYAVRIAQIVGAFAGLVGGAMSHALRIGPNWKNAWKIAVIFWTQTLAGVPFDPRGCEGDEADPSE